MRVAIAQGVLLGPYDYYVYTLASSIPTHLTRFNDRRYGYVFYVGKGIGARIHFHEEDARRGHDCMKCDLIRELWDKGASVNKRILFASPDQNKVLRHEYDLIAKIGLENLLNRLNGTPEQWTPEEKIEALHRKYAEEED